MKTDARSGVNALVAMCLVAAPIQVAHASGPGAPADDKPGSAYLQCDGKPNNVTSGETAARLIGAVTLLGLFAKPAEAPDASKRKFGAEGIAVCDTLLVGEKKEGNPARRIDLLLGRAIHRSKPRIMTARSPTPNRRAAKPMPRGCSRIPIMRAPPAAPST